MRRCAVTGARSTRAQVVDPYTVRFTATVSVTSRRWKCSARCRSCPSTCWRTSGRLQQRAFQPRADRHGPYKFVRWDTGSQVVLERNDHYWGPRSNHYLNRIVYRIIQEPYVAAQLLKKGEIDLIDGMQPLQWTRELDAQPPRCRTAHPRRSTITRPTTTSVQPAQAAFPGHPGAPRDRPAHPAGPDPRADLSQPVRPHDRGLRPARLANYNHDIPSRPTIPRRPPALLQQAGWKLDPGDGLLHKDGQTLSAFTANLPRRQYRTARRFSSWYPGIAASTLAST